MPEIPLIDFADFYSADPAARQKLVDQVRDSCLYNGFFQIKNHSVPLEQQAAVMAYAKRLFALSPQEKQQVSKDKTTWNRGYEMLRSQILEAGTQPELKEGFYIGDEIATDHPYFVHKKLNSGPNQWPAALGAGFPAAAMAYYRSTVALAADVLQVLALSLGLEQDYFAGFMEGAVATMRLLHYPPQPPDADEKLSRGIGAHTDFGAITLLLQGEVDGLQVWDAKSDTWIDVKPTEGALVVNLGNLMARWTNEKYKSNVHRVINKSGQERYSIPVFLSGNPDYMVECIPTCKAPGTPAKFPPISVQEAVSAAYAESYGRAQLYRQGLETKVAVGQTSGPNVVEASTQIPTV